VNTKLQVLDTPVRPIRETYLTVQTVLTGKSTESDNLATKCDENIKAKLEDWRAPIVSYLKDPGRGAERNIQHLSFKYILIDDELYRGTVKILLLK